MQTMRLMSNLSLESSRASPVTYSLSESLFVEPRLWLRSRVASHVAMLVRKFEDRLIAKNSSAAVLDHTVPCFFIA